MLRSRKIALASVLLLPVVAGGFLLQGRRTSDLLLEQVMSLVTDKFVDTLPQNDVFEKAARGLVKELNDPYSELLTPKDLKQFDSRTEGRYGGLGMLIQPKAGGGVEVVTVYPNTPAERAGIREGDRIIKADTNSTLDWSTQQVSDALTGPPGTKVTATFARPGVPAPITATFVREIIKVPAIPYTLVLGNKIGYIPLVAFNQNAADNLDTTLKRLQRQGVRGVVLDMRGNPGGILDQSLSIANMFLRDGQEIASVKGRSGTMDDYKARGVAVAPTLPLIVLTDERTASASEIVAGALQDHDRALVLGQTSYGKGLVQAVYKLDGGYALKLTTAKWFTPSGRSIQRPRKFVNGQFVEETPDTNETDATKKARPAYKSDAGRVIYGGGGITPDVIVQDDTLTTPEQQFARAVAPKIQDFFTVRDDYAIELSKTVKPGFQVQPAWMDEFFNRIHAKGITNDRKAFDAANRYVARLLDLRITHFAFGDSVVKRRDLQYDAPLRKALDMLDKGTTQRDLFAMAGEPLGTAAAPKPKKP